VIAIDDRTIKEYGRLRYWSRDRYASLLDRLGQAKAVDLDILFTEADQKDPEGDAKLAQAIRKNGRTALACYEWREVRPFSNEVQSNLTAALKRFQKADRPFWPQELPQVRPETLEMPIPSLVQSAAAMGFAGVNADSDGVYRNPILLKMTAEGRMLPHIALATACLAEKKSLGEVVTDRGLKLKGRIVPLVDGALMLQPIARRGGTFAAGIGEQVTTLSFVDAINSAPEEFAGKIVLVGETATGTADVRPNPLDSGLRGVELNAEILANLLYLPSVRPLPLTAQWILIIVAAGMPLWLYGRLNPHIANLGAIATFALLIGVMEIAFWGFRMIPSWSPVLIGLLGATLLMAVQRYAQEEALKRQLRRSFSSYVAPELVEAIVANPEIAQQEGTRRRVAVLFSDVRQFTAYCEQHSPEFVVRQIREYLDEMTAVVDQYNGVLDKYIGDGVMALFGPFLPEKVNLSALAVKCGLDMMDRLADLNERWAANEMPPYKIGIGIHEGEAIVGNIGAPRRMQYTAIGDTVNLASRLQVLTKDLQASFIISEDAKSSAQLDLGDDIDFISRGTVAVRNREQPVSVYEVRRKGADHGTS
jgi:adenylate cyclase